MTHTENATPKFDLAKMLEFVNTDEAFRNAVSQAAVAVHIGDGESAKISTFTVSTLLALHFGSLNEIIYRSIRSEITEAEYTQQMIAEANAWEQMAKNMVITAAMTLETAA